MSANMILVPGKRLGETISGSRTEFAKAFLTCRIRNVLAVVLFIFAAVAASSSTAKSLPTCDFAAGIAARESGVPFPVLQSITRSETGRTRNGVLEPWPWTVNMKGQGHWFETEERALAYVVGQYKRGARSFDVGCFQINFKWHGAAFESIDQMFDPVENARYAATFLKQLKAELGSWSLAAGAYHSRTPKHANRYQARFERIRQSIEGGMELASVAPAVQSGESQNALIRMNSYPLLQVAEGAGRYGSLVPMRETGSGALITFTGGS